MVLSSKYAQFDFMLFVNLFQPRVTKSFIGVLTMEEHATLAYPVWPYSRNVPSEVKKRMSSSFNLGTPDQRLKVIKLRKLLNQGS